MKIDVSIEATPQEMREFLGLPNLQPLQEEMLQTIRDNMRKEVTGFDPLSLMKPMLPAQLHSMEVLQKAFWDAFTKTAGSADTSKPEGAVSTGDKPKSK